jgi:hypothetical protein
VSFRLARASLRPALRRLAFVPATALLTAACGVADVFTSAGAGGVVFVWESDSVIGRDEVIPVRITVLADGEPLADPRLVITVPDTSHIAPTANGDSLIGRQSGRGDVVVELLSSLTTGVPPDTVFSIRVTGAPP